MDDPAPTAPLRGGLARLAHHLPKSEAAIHDFHAELVGSLKTRSPEALAIRSPAVRALGNLIDSDAITRMYTVQVLEQVQVLPGAPESTITTIPEFLAALDYITTLAPLYNVDPARRNAFPMSTLLAYMMMTVAGEALFRMPAFNDGLRAILKEWCAYLDSPASASVLNYGPTGWLCPAAVDEFQLIEYIWDWTTYNEFFHREIQLVFRMVASPDDDSVVVSANDGNLVSISRNVQRQDTFWAKAEQFSLVDMLNGSQYVDRFVGGDVFQTFLSGANYHRWRSPIRGTVVHWEIVNGLQFSNAESAGFDPDAVLSEGYYASVNTRALVYIESPYASIGTVCVMPIGITEISSVTVTVQKGQQVDKGYELGYFSYGGSSMCLVFQPGAIESFTIDNAPRKPLVDPSKGPAVRVNWPIATARLS